MCGTKKLGILSLSPKKGLISESYPSHGGWTEYPREDWSNLPQVIIGAEFPKTLLLHDSEVVIAFHTPDLLESPIELFNSFIQLLQLLAEWVGLGLRLRLNLIQIGPEEVE